MFEEATVVDLRGGHIFDYATFRVLRQALEYQKSYTIY